MDRVQMLRRILSAGAVAGTLTVQPSAKDLLIISANANGNYGTLTYVQVLDTDSWPRRSILTFDISALPAKAKITAATLSLYYYRYQNNDPVDRTVWAYKLTRTDWVENQATWNSYKTDSAWTTAGGDFVTSSPSGGSVDMPDSYGWVDFNVLNIVEDAYTNSNPVEILIKFALENSSTEAITSFYGRRYTTDTTLHPKLVIDYKA